MSCPLVNIHFQEAISFIQESTELIRLDLVATMMGNNLLSMHPLESHFTAVSFQKEVGELVKVDLAIVVLINSIEVSHQIVDLRFTFIFEELFGNSLKLAWRQGLLVH